MRVIKREDIIHSIKNPLGEEIYELIGSSPATGETTHHSLVHVVIPPGKSSQAHYHKVSEETYYILKGEGFMVVNKEEFPLKPGQACLIEPLEVHQIFNKVDVDLEFLTVSAPAWTPNDWFHPTEEKFE